MWEEGTLLERFGFTDASQVNIPDPVHLQSRSQAPLIDQYACLHGAPEVPQRPLRGAIHWRGGGVVVHLHAARGTAWLIQWLR